MAMLHGDAVLIVFFTDFLPEPTRRPVAGVYLQQGWVLLLALFTRVVAAWHERAHIRQIDQVRWKPTNWLEFLFPRSVKTRNRLQEPHGVGVTRIGEDFFRRCGLD